MPMRQGKMPMRQGKEGRVGEVRERRATVPATVAPVRTSKQEAAVAPVRT